MQIILDQNEIETAIRALVNDQVSVKDGHEITIDLKAGRGENGFTATIDISPVGAGKPAPAGTSKPLGIEKETARTPKTTAAAETKGPTPDAPKVEATPETAPEAASDAPGVDSTDAAPETPVDAQAASQAEDAAPELDGESPAKGPGPSLFANLGKPRNQ